LVESILVEFTLPKRIWDLMEERMETSKISCRIVGGDDDDEVRDGETISITMHMRDSAPAGGDRQQLDDATKAYLERSARLSDAWRHGRGMPGVGKVGRVDDEELAAPRVATVENAQRLRDAAASEYAARVANAWRANRG
jgi:hypothetical protein